jgi:hypothetical protein
MSPNYNPKTVGMYSNEPMARVAMIVFEDFEIRH